MVGQIGGVSVRVLSSRHARLKCCHHKQAHCPGPAKGNSTLAKVTGNLSFGLKIFNYLKCTLQKDMLGVYCPFTSRDESYKFTTPGYWSLPEI